MSFKEELKNEARQERQKLKGMSFRDKIWYIWEYYKLHMLAVLGFVLLLSVIGTSIYNSTFETVFYCAVINNPSADGIDDTPLTEDFRQQMGFGEKEQVFVESMYVSYQDDASEYAYASMAKLSALIAARELDVIISDQEIFDRHSHMDGYMDLESALPGDLFALLQEQDRLCYNTDSAGNSHVYAIDIKGTSLAQDMGITLDPAYFSILSSSQHTDTCVALIQNIFAP